MTEVRKLLTDNSLVTLTGVGGAATTRLAVEVAARMAEKDCGQPVSEWHRRPGVR